MENVTEYNSVVCLEITRTLLSIIKIYDLIVISYFCLSKAI